VGRDLNSAGRQAGQVDISGREGAGGGAWQQH
jgi:hypothetical protein